MYLWILRGKSIWGSASVRYHRFERAHEEHDHIPLPEAELVRIEELDEETRGNYDAFAQWCRDREEAGSSV